MPLNTTKRGNVNNVLEDAECFIVLDVVVADVDFCEVLEDACMSKNGVEEREIQV